MVCALPGLLSVRLEGSGGLVFQSEAYRWLEDLGGWEVGSVDCGCVWLKRINEMYGQEGLDLR